MLAILLAAQLSATVTVLDLTVHHRPTVAFRQNLVRPEVICPASAATDASNAAPSVLRPQDQKDLRTRKLADLPKANKEVAVARTVSGCAVPVGVRYSVEGDGTFARDGR